MVYLDTHIAVWLASGDVQLLTAAARTSIESNDLMISPMVFLELQFLREKGKVIVSPHELLSILTADFGVGMCTCPFPKIAGEAVALSWARNPFDRMIVANALATQSRLITNDQVILEHFPGAIW